MVTAYKIEPLLKEELFLVGRNLMGTADSMIDFSQLERYRLILPKSQHAMNQTLNRFTSEHGVKLCMHTVSTPMHPMLRMACEGQGHSLLP